MRGTCENCGTRTYDGRCGNCHEELAIYEDQGQYMDRPFSDQFMQKVVEQRNQINSREKSHGRQS